MDIVYQTQNINTPEIQTDATALAANTARKGWIIQNCGQNPLFVRFGSGASTSLFHVVLAATTSANDNGTGGIYEQTNGIVYTGAITVAGTSPRYVATEM